MLFRFEEFSFSHLHIVGVTRALRLHDKHTMMMTNHTHTPPSYTPQHIMVTDSAKALNYCVSIQRISPCHSQIIKRTCPLMFTHSTEVSQISQLVALGVCVKPLVTSHYKAQLCTSQPGLKKPHLYTTNKTKLV